MFTTLSVGNIIRFEDELCLVTLNRDINGYISLTYLTGNDAGTTVLRHISQVCNNVEKRYRGIEEYVSIFKEKVNDYCEAYYAVKQDLVDANDIINFKDGEIKRLSKELVKSANKDEFDKAVNDMLNSKDISSVEEVSALMKIRALLYK